MSDDTERVLRLIDRTLDDPDVSDDAMRSVPDDVGELPECRHTGCPVDGDCLRPEDAGNGMTYWPPPMPAPPAVLQHQGRTWVHDPEEPPLNPEQAAELRRLVRGETVDATVVDEDDGDRPGILGPGWTEVGWVDEAEGARAWLAREDIAEFYRQAGEVQPWPGETYIDDPACGHLRCIGSDTCRWDTYYPDEAQRAAAARLVARAFDVPLRLVVPGVTVGPFPAPPSPHFHTDAQGNLCDRHGNLVIDREAVRESVRSIVARMTEIRDAMSRASAQMVRHVHVVRETMRSVGAAIPTGEDEHADESPADRALRLRRERNTGPPRNPHRHRGMR